MPAADRNRTHRSIEVSVQMLGLTPDLQTALEDQFKAFPLINVVDGSADLVLEENNEHTRGGEAQLVTNQEYVLHHSTYTDVDLAAQKFTERILAYAQANYHSSLINCNETPSFMTPYIMYSSCSSVSYNE